MTAIWLLLFHIFRLDRLKWFVLLDIVRVDYMLVLTSTSSYRLFFIMQGWGVYPAEYKEKNAKAGAKSNSNAQTPPPPPSSSLLKFGSTGSVEPDGDAVRGI